MARKYRPGSASNPSRTCTRCGRSRRIAYARRNWPNYAEGVYICKSCNDPPKLQYPEQKRDWWYQRQYGITIADYEVLLAQQGGLCAICRRPPKQYRLHVDHDHSTGAVRGLLCAHCNSALEWMLTLGAQAQQYLGGQVPTS